MPAVRYKLRQPSAKSAQPIYFVFRYQETRLLLATGLKVLPEYWNAKTQRVKNTSNVPERDAINAALADIEAEADRFYNEARARRSFSITEMKPHIIGFINGINGNPTTETQAKAPETFFEFCRRFIEESRERIQPNGKTIHPRTIQKYQATVNLLEAFAQKKGKGVSFEGFDLEFYQDFTRWLQKRPHQKGSGYGANAIGKHIQVIKTFLNEANAQGVADHHGHKSKYFKVTKEESENIYLDEKELAALLAFPLDHLPHLERVRDLFIVGAWTGLRFTDFTTLDPAKNFVERNGERLIEVVTAKTGAKVLIPEFAAVRSIVEKYNGKLPRAISNQKFNEYLKEACKLAGISQPVTKGRTVAGVRRVDTFEKWELVSTHTARRSFATNLHNRGVSSISIMMVTGHATQQAFLKYIKAGAEEHALILKKAFQSEQAEQQKAKIVNL
ncbi:MAG: site-specific integrase [Chitinophagales bacterium]|nr:site-specific integrase [Chitinophagales bacterium]